jgi:hypothetical protein
MWWIVGMGCEQEVTLTFGHFTYLQGESDTMFLNDASHLFWTQVVINEDWGVKQGMLFDYSLQYPHAFRYGAIPFGPQPSVRCLRRSSCFALLRFALLWPAHTNLVVWPLLIRRGGEHTPSAAFQR